MQFLKNSAAFCFTEKIPTGKLKRKKYKMQYTAVSLIYVLSYLFCQNFVCGAVNWNSGRVLKELQSHLVSLVGILEVDGFSYLFFPYKDIDSFDDQQF